MPVPPASPVSYPVEYNRAAGADYNLDFRDAGRLVIDPVGPTYTFTGRGRDQPGDLTLVFTPADIANVAVREGTVYFKTALGRTGAKREPFVFHLADAATAREVALALPRTLDAEVTDAHTFARRLGALGRPTPAWASPTNVLIALNVAAFIVMGCFGAGWFQAESMEPYVLFAANNGAATTGGEWWRLVTSMFVHYGLLHLALNLWALHQAGHFVERLLGRTAFVLMYFASGLAGGFASILWHGDRSWSAGASGAVFGVYGAILGFMLRQREAVPRTVFRSMVNSTLTFAGYNIVFGLVQRGVDNSAHLGGALGGLAFGWLLALPLDRSLRRARAAANAGLGLVTLALLVAAGVAVTPRFDYDVREELAWDRVNAAPLEREAALAARHDRLQAGMGGDTDPAAYAAWLEQELIPFYTGWSAQLGALRLQRGRATARNRDEFRGIIDARAENLRALAAALRRHDPAALARYRVAEAAVTLRLQALGRSGH